MLVCVTPNIENPLLSPIDCQEHPKLQHVSFLQHHQCSGAVISNLPTLSQASNICTSCCFLILSIMIILPWTLRGVQPGWLRAHEYKETGNQAHSGGVCEQTHQKPRASSGRFCRYTMELPWDPPALYKVNCWEGKMWSLLLLQNSKLVGDVAVEPPKMGRLV